MQNEYLCFLERIDWTQPKLRKHSKREAACFKPALILLIVWDNVTLSSCGHSISQETDSCFRHPIWSIGLYLGRISHAWCQISFICRVPLCPLLSLNNHHCYSSHCGNPVSCFCVGEHDCINTNRPSADICSALAVLCWWQSWSGLVPELVSKDPETLLVVVTPHWVLVMTANQQLTCRSGSI